MAQVDPDRPTEDEKAASRRKHGVAAKVGKRVGSAALRGAVSTARLAGRAAVGGGEGGRVLGQACGEAEKSLVGNSACWRASRRLVVSRCRTNAGPDRV